MLTGCPRIGILANLRVISPLETMYVFLDFAFSENLLRPDPFCFCLDIKRGAFLKLGFGTVQFGMYYGISNPNGKTPLGEIKAILQVAQENGIDIIDTAFSYGNSESTMYLKLLYVKPKADSTP